MGEVAIKAVARPAGRKGPARRLRKDGYVPGVVYGGDKSVLLSLSSKELLKFLEDREKSRSVFAVSIEGEKTPRNVLIRSIDVHPITDKVLHIDLWEVSLDKKIKVKIPLSFSGTAKGVKEQGGTLKVARQNINVQCLPQDIKYRLDFPIEDMEAGQTWAMGDLALGDKYDLLEDPKLTVVAIVIPKKVVETTDEEGAETEAATA